MNDIEMLVLSIQEKIGDTEDFLKKYNKGDFTLFNKMSEICGPELTKLSEDLKNECKWTIRTVMEKNNSIIFDIEPKILNGKKQELEFVEDIWENFMMYKFPSAILKFKTTYKKKFKNYIKVPVEWMCLDYIKKKKFDPLDLQTTVNTEEPEKMLDQLTCKKNHNSPETKYLLINFLKEYLDIINTIHTKVRNPNLLNKIFIHHCRRLCGEKKIDSCISTLKKLQNKPLVIVAKRIEQEYNTRYGIDGSEHLFEKLISRIHTEGEDRIFLDGVDLDNKSIIIEWIREIHEILENSENKEKIRELRSEYFYSLI
jgi:hypothetical protein